MDGAAQVTVYWVITVDAYICTLRKYMHMPVRLGLFTIVS